MVTLPSFAAGDSVLTGTFGPVPGSAQEAEQEGQGSGGCGTPEELPCPGGGPDEEGSGEVEQTAGTAAVAHVLSLWCGPVGAGSITTMPTTLLLSNSGLHCSSAARQSMDEARGRERQRASVVRAYEELIVTPR